MKGDFHMPGPCPATEQVLNVVEKVLEKIISTPDNTQTDNK